MKVAIGQDSHKLKYGNEKKLILSRYYNDMTQSEVSKELGIDQYYASLLPQDKLSYLSKIIDNKKGQETVVFVGDGINDTPSLKLADVGIAMGDIDAAISASDIVLMNSDVSKVYDSIKIAKFTKKIVIQNIVFALLIKILAMFIAGTNLLGMFGMYFAVLSDVGVCLITILIPLILVRDDKYPGIIYFG